MDAISQLRKEIDGIDRQILALLNERYTLARRIGRAKKDAGLPVRVPEREEALLAALVERSCGSAVPETALKAIYRAIIDGAVALEEEEKPSRSR